MPKSDTFEYIVRARKENSIEVEGEYEVLKFDADTLARGGSPVAVYTVKYNPPRQMGRCNCPAAEFRGTGPKDKHVEIVRQWIAGGRTTSIVR